MSKLEKNNKGNSRASMLGTETIVVNQNDSTITQYGKIAGVNYKMIEKLEKPSSFLLIDEDKVIDGFKCKKAIDKTNDITIWYQPDRKRVAPRKEFSIIPGIVIKVKGKQREYELVSISEETTADSLFTIPKTHKQITQEQHRDLREEAVEELQQSMGAGSRIIQTRDN
jgi:GLPGLI family protein